MKDQNKQQEMQALEEACLDLVTGAGNPGSSNSQPSGQPWNYPFDSPREAPAAERLIKPDPLTNPALIAKALESHTLKAIAVPHVAESTERIHVHPDGQVSLLVKKTRAPLK
jgi:hypothetical protein